MPVCLVTDPLSVSPWTEGQPCAGVVLVQAADVPPNPFYLSAGEGALIGGAVASVWVTAWCLKALRITLNTDGINERESP